MTNIGRTEVALDADRTAKSTWGYTYTDLTSRTQRNDQAIKAGREDRTEQLNPARLATVLGNGDGQLTPGNAVSTYYPGWDQGALMRYSVEDQTPYLRLDGITGVVSTPDAASLDITGDNWGAIQFRGPCPGARFFLGLGISGAWSPTLVSKYTASGNQRSIWLLTQDNYPRLGWTTDGTTGTQIEEEGTARIPQPWAGSNTLAWHIDVDNLAGGYTVTFYFLRGTIAALRTAITANDLTVRLGSQIVRTAGTTSIFSSSANLRVGWNADVGGPTWGQVEAFEWRSGDHTGVVVANPNFAGQAAGTTSFADTAAVPKTWTISGGASIDDIEPRQFAEIGAIEPHWPGDGVDDAAAVTVTAQGISRRLRQGEQPLESALTRWVKGLQGLLGDIVTHWSYEDGSDATEVTSSIIGAGAVTLTGNYRLGSDSGSLKAAKSVMSVADGETVTQAALIPPVANVAGVRWQYLRLVRIATPGATTSNLGAIYTNGRAARWRLTVNSTNLTVTATDGDGATIATTTVSAPQDPEWFWVRLEVIDDGANVDYEIGFTYVTGQVGTGLSNTGTFVGAMGVPTRFRNNLTGPPDGIEVSHIIIGTNVTVSGVALVEPPIVGYPATFAHAGEEAAYRVQRLCVEEGVHVAIHGDNRDGYWPFFSDPDKDRSGTPMGPQLADRPLTDLIEEAAFADGGLLTEHRTESGYHYRTRGSMYNQATRLDVDQGLIDPFEPSLDDVGRVNEVKVTRVDGSSSTALDEDSIDRRGRYLDNPTVSLESDDQTADQAGWRLHLGTTDKMRVPSLTLELAKDDAVLRPAWLAFAPGDVVRCQNPPPWWPDPEIRQLVIGWTETISPHLWTVQAVTTDAARWDVGTLDTTSPDTDSFRLTSEDSTLAEALTTTETDVDVAFTTTRWVTTASESAHLPFDIIVSGEVMTVTAVAGTTSPQTFTVTRSVNGVVKSHGSGAVVEVYEPLRLVI